MLQLQYRYTFSVLAGLILCLILFSEPARPDAVIRTQAMRASTIAEFYIEEDVIQVELEIGPNSIKSFRNLLPDQIYKTLGYEARPLSERLPEFFSKDLFITTDKGKVLEGRLLKIGPRKRIKRDEITGEALPVSEEKAEDVVFVRLEYVLGEKPAALTLNMAGTRAEIGFVAYHNGVAINDFRYLWVSQTVALDWKDPWYSHFSNKALRRTYSEPMSGFIYVEPYEVRKEIIARPKDLQRWLDLGLAGRDTIPVELQPEIKSKVAEFLRVHQKVLIDGKEVTPDLARINFLERTLKTSRVIDPPEELNLNSAILGTIFVYPTEGLPQKVTMDWDLFDDRIERISASAVDQAGPFPTYLTPDWSTLEWVNYLKKPILPTFKVVRTPPDLFESGVLYARWIFAALTVLFISLLIISARRNQELRPKFRLVGLTLLCTAGLFLAAEDFRMTEQRENQVVSGLLHNIYRAFDFREEEKIYDLLARSVSGDLLRQVYLETRKGLELASQGGARVKIKQVELAELSTNTAERGGFTAEATWRAGGSVGHWGHVHQRTNQYRAKLQVEPVDGVWKLTRAEILEEERL